MKTRRRRTMQAALATIVALAGSAAGTGQVRPDGGTDLPTRESREGPTQLVQGALILEREAYAYPARGRRNPFLPSDVSSPPAPAVEEIVLLGIIHHPDPRFRVAVIRVPGVMDGTAGAGGGPIGAPIGPPASRLRTGELLVGMRIVAIEVDHVVVELEEPGGTTTKVLAMPRAEKGRGS